MNSKLAVPGIGGAAAVLIAWWFESRYGAKPTAEQVAAIATIVSAAAGYTDEILEAIKCGVLRIVAIADHRPPEPPKEGTPA